MKSRYAAFLLLVSVLSFGSFVWPQQVATTRLTYADDVPAKKSSKAPKPDILLPQNITGVTGQPIYILADTLGKSVRWYSLDPGLTVVPTEKLKNTLEGCAFAAKDGSYRIVAYTSIADMPSEWAVTIIQVGDAPPGPGPGPGPTPGPTPFPVDGFHVLMVWDQPSEGKLTPQQLDVLYGKKVRDYLNAKCKPDGFRIWPSGYTDDQVAADAKVYQDAYKRKRDKLPWIVIGSKTSGYEGPLPANEDDAITLFDKYAPK